MKTKSKTSPKGGKRGCLCEDGKYSKECCTGDLESQGVGSELSQGSATVSNTNTPRTIVSVSN